MKRSTCRIAGILPMLLISGLLSCEEHNAEPDQSYFPLDPQHEWRYQRWIANGLDNPPGQLFDTLVLTVQNDVTVEGKVYKEVVDEIGILNKIVRREGSKYFARNHELYQSDFSHEYVFLDTDKAVGESWSYIKDEGQSKTEYVIHAKNATHTIQGVEYKHVIEVEVNYYYLAPGGDFEQWGTVVHYYAAGVGEIFHHYPYPTLMYGDVSSFIMPGKK
jgi:hypothetical protein